MKVVRVFGPLAGVVLLAGCMGSNGDNTPAVVTFQDQAVASVKQFAALDQLSSTAFSSMPTTGTATYAGDAAMSVTVSGTEYALLGAASVVADFQNSTVSGNLTGFHGGPIAAGDIFPTANDDYAGTIALTAGQIGVARSNDFTANFAGTLVGAGNTIVASGAVTGDFKGSPIKGIIGTSAPGAVGTVNGVAASDLFLDLWAK